MISFLENYIGEIEENNERHLTVFCDSCSGQNKNHAFLFMHYVVHTMKSTDSFPHAGPFLHGMRQEYGIN